MYALCQVDSSTKWWWCHLGLALLGGPSFASAACWCCWLCTKKGPKRNCFKTLCTYAKPASDHAQLMPEPMVHYGAMAQLKLAQCLPECSQHSPPRAIDSICLPSFLMSGHVGSGGQNRIYQVLRTPHSLEPNPSIVIDICRCASYLGKLKSNLPDFLVPGMAVRAHKIWSDDDDHGRGDAMARMSCLTNKC